MIGTLIDFTAVITGGLIGWILKKIFPEKIKTVAFEAIGISILGLGLSMIIKMNNPLVMIVSILGGGIVGNILAIDGRLNGLLIWVKKKFKIHEKGLVDGLMTMFLAACVGSLAILGPINEGVSGDLSLLMTKSVLDFLTAISLASSVGPGVILASLPLLFFQGLLTLFASQLKPFISTNLINELNAVGGLLIIGIGLNILKVTKIKIANYLPGLIIVTLLTILLG